MALLAGRRGTMLSWTLHLAQREQVMAASSVRVQRDGRIAVVRIDAGDERNLMSHQVMTDLTAAARGFEDDATTSAIVLTGSSRVFTLGFDLSGAAAELPLSEQLPSRTWMPRERA